MLDLLRTVSFYRDTKYTYSTWSGTLDISNTAQLALRINGETRYLLFQISAPPYTRRGQLYLCRGSGINDVHFLVKPAVTLTFDFTVEDYGSYVTFRVSGSNASANPTCGIIQPVHLMLNLLYANSPTYQVFYSTGVTAYILSGFVNLGGFSVDIPSPMPSSGLSLEVKATPQSETRQVGYASALVQPSPFGQSVSIEIG